MKYNKPLVAILIGCLSTIPYEIFTRLLVSIGFGKYSEYQLSSLIITLNRPNTILGIVTSSLVGASIAVVFYYSLKKVGWDYLVVKGLVIGLLGWIAMEVLFVWLIEGPKLIQPRPLSDYFIQMIGATIFGFTMGLLFRKFLLKKSIGFKI